MSDELNKDIKTEDELNKRDLEDTIDLKYIVDEIEKLKSERKDLDDNISES
jgi:hypothetical protein